jgi:hypothetical protein
MARISRPDKTPLQAEPKFDTIGICHMCKHRLVGTKCLAYPDGIPLPILTGDIDHREPYPGDHGLQFEWDGETQA